jgi:hypothetical protein
MAVVAGAMMIVVGDSSARAFGIFAAASLVRFRTNIRDPKETTVLLICLGIGLAAGVGLSDMAVILMLFVLIALSVLEYFERYQVFRSMEVRIQTLRVDSTDAVLKKLFERYGFEYELRELNREDQDEPMGTIVYLVNVEPVASTSDMSDEIISADRDNVDSVEWDQKESKTASISELYLWFRTSLIETVGIGGVEDGSQNRGWRYSWLLRRVDGVARKDRVNHDLALRRKWNG